jgi:hypothetical protein
MILFLTHFRGDSTSERIKDNGNVLDIHDWPMTDPLESNGCGRGYRINAKWGGSRVVVCIKTISNIKGNIVSRNFSQKDCGSQYTKQIWPNKYTKQLNNTLSGYKYRKKTIFNLIEYLMVNKYKLDSSTVQWI